MSKNCLNCSIYSEQCITSPQNIRGVQGRGQGESRKKSDRLPTNSNSRVLNMIIFGF